MVVENRVLQKVVFPIISLIPALQYLKQIPNPDSPKNTSQSRMESNIPASITVKAAPRLATILCLEVSFTPETA